MKQETIDRYHERVLPRLGDYLKAERIPFSDVDESCECPHCRKLAFFLDGKYWLCDHCGHKGDVLDFARAQYPGRDDWTLLRHICRKLRVKVETLDVFSAAELAAVEGDFIFSIKEIVRHFQVLSGDFPLVGGACDALQWDGGWRLVGGCVDASKFEPCVVVEGIATGEGDLLAREGEILSGGEVAVDGEWRGEGGGGQDVVFAADLGDLEVELLSGGDGWHSEEEILDGRDNLGEVRVVGRQGVRRVVEGDLMPFAVVGDFLGHREAPVCSPAVAGAVFEAVVENELEFQRCVAEVPEAHDDSLGGDEAASSHLEVHGVGFAVFAHCPPVEGLRFGVDADFVVVEIVAEVWEGVVDFPRAEGCSVKVDGGSCRCAKGQDTEEQGGEEEVS